jgi:signal transduction histidine kinase
MAKKSKILIVDDAVDTVELLRKRFQAEGYETAEAYNGEEGLQKVPEFNPDLIVLDIMMPKIDGYEVCQRLKADENTKYIPILMLTAKGEVEDKIKGLDIGADDYLSKPFEYKELSARARSLLTTKAAHEKKVEEEKSGALEQMMDQVAHEIRNPLTAIGGFARKVYRNLPENDSNRKYMEIILEDVTVLENMIKQLIELKSMDISYKEPTNINDVIQESLNIFKQDFKKNGIQVNIELFDNPPLISTDKKLFTRVLCNLIKNSIEAMESGKKFLTITTRLSGDHFSIIVSDTGKGIPKDKIKNIFDPLVTSKVYGPGLGLPFALKIVQDHSGTIDVESEPEKGTTFTITIPLQET